MARIHEYINPHPNLIKAYHTMGKVRCKVRLLYLCILDMNILPKSLHTACTSVIITCNLS